MEKTARVLIICSNHPIMRDEACVVCHEVTSLLDERELNRICDKCGKRVGAFGHTMWMENA